MSHNSPQSPTSDTTDDYQPNKVLSYTTDNVWANQDTIHYLSPATSARTQCEGDFDYGQFLMRPELITYPDFRSESSLSCDETQLQRTLTIVKPEAMVYQDVVLKVIQESGLDIVNQRVVHLTPEQVAEVYAQHYGCPSFPNIVVSMSVGPLLVLSLAGIQAVEKWKSIIGPYKTLKEEWFMPINVRNRFGFHVDIPEALHASETLRDANKENRYFYPDSVLEPITCEDDKVKDYCDLYVNPTLLNGLVELVRVKPVDPILFLAEWLLLNNPFQPRLPYRLALSPT